MMIQDALIGDAKEILELQKLAYQTEAELYNDYTIPPLTQTLDQFEKDFKTHVILKAMLEGQIVGSVRAIRTDNTCYIGRLIVHPKNQGMGIGTKLMNAIEQRFSCAKRFELFAGAQSENNIQFYEKLGYTIFKKSRQSPKVELEHMEKLITN